MHWGRLVDLPIAGLILALAIYAVWRKRTAETWFFAALGVFGGTLEAVVAGATKTNVLAGEMPPWEAVQEPAGLERLWVFGSGPVPAQPAELLQSDLMRELLAERRKVADFVIIEAPAALNASDSARLCTLLRRRRRSKVSLSPRPSSRRSASRSDAFELAMLIVPIRVGSTGAPTELPEAAGVPPLKQGSS